MFSGWQKNYFAIISLESNQIGALQILLYVFLKTSLTVTLKLNVEVFFFCLNNPAYRLVLESFVLSRYLSRFTCGNPLTVFNWQQSKAKGIVVAVVVVVVVAAAVVVGVKVKVKQCLYFQGLPYID